MLRIQPWLQLYLPTQPEYRMGVQKVTAKLNTGGVEKGYICNSTIFFKEGETPWELIYDWNFVLTQAARSSLIVTDVTLIPREPESLRGVRQIALSHEKYAMLANRTAAAVNFSAGPTREALIQESRVLALNAKTAAAEDAPVTLTTAGEIFKRFSAYPNDNRITPGKGLTPGTFATTKEDADAHVRTGADAVARYALPNPKPASNVFTITPAADSELKRGTTQPAYGQPGGGVEVIFVNGLPDGTVTGPTTIPDK